MNRRDIVIHAVCFTLALAINVNVEAAKKKKNSQAEFIHGKEVPKGNWIDLRQEVFTCSDWGCVLPVRGILIACTVSGCAPITDIIAPPGAVQRVDLTPELPRVSSPSSAK